MELTQQAFFEDVAFWHTKKRVDNPVLWDGDGPIHKLRQWYNQFYVDIADVPDTWNESRTYSVDAFNPIPEQKMAAPMAGEESASNTHAAALEA